MTVHIGIVRPGRTPPPHLPRHAAPRTAAAVLPWCDGHAARERAGREAAVAVDCRRIAMAQRAVRGDRVFAYTSGDARNRINDLHAAAREIIERGEV